MKPFDKDLFEKYDEAARAATTPFISGQGWQVQDHPDVYAHDLLATKDGITLFVECEVKALWKSGEFPFPSVQLPARKRKFFHPNAIFFIWRKDLGDAVYFWARDIDDLETVQVPNKYMQDEYFFQVPLSRVKLVSNAPIQD